MCLFFVCALARAATAWDPAKAAAQRAWVRRLHDCLEHTSAESVGLVS